MTRTRKALYRHVAKPVLFSLSPDTAHKVVIRGMAIGGRVPGVAAVTRKLGVRPHPNLAMDWRGMHFTSPVGLSAGLDKNGEVVPMIQALGFGFAEVGSVTAGVCHGNERPWFYRLPETQSLVVHVGLANHGVQKITNRLESHPVAVQTHFPTILSLARTNSKEAAGVDEGIKDFITSARRAKESAAVQMIELNISCPNAYGGETYTTAALLEKLLTAIDEVQVGKPIFVKMPVEVAWQQFKGLLDVAVAHGVTGVTISNLLKNREGVVLKDELPDHVRGGLSGAPLRERSTKLIHKTYTDYGDKLTIIGVGGVLSAQDAYDKIKAGATFVELVTGLILNGPQFIEEVNRGLEILVAEDGYAHVGEAVGAAHRLAP